MTTQATIEQLDEQITRLTPQDQLKLVARVSARLSDTNAIPEKTDTLDQHRDERSDRVNELIARYDAIASETLGTFDSAADLRRLRDEDE